MDKPRRGASGPGQASRGAGGRVRYPDRSEGLSTAARRWVFVRPACGAVLSNVGEPPLNRPNLGKLDALRRPPSQLGKVFERQLALAYQGKICDWH